MTGREAQPEPAANAGVTAGMIRARSVAGGLVIVVVTLAAAWLSPVGGPAKDSGGPLVEAQGVLVSVDPNADAFTIAGAAGTQEFYVTPETVIEVGRTERVSFRDLANFIGTASIVQSADTGAGQDASRVTLLVMPFRETLPAPGRPDTR